MLTNYTHTQGQTVVIYLSIIYLKSLPTPIWQQHFCRLVMWCRPKCLSINRQIYQNVSVLCHTTMYIRLSRLYRLCMDFKSVRNAWKCNWNDRRKQQGHIKYNIRRGTYILIFIIQCLLCSTVCSIRTFVKFFLKYRNSCLLEF